MKWNRHISLEEKTVLHDEISDEEYRDHLMHLFAALDSGRGGLVFAAYAELECMSSERINRIMSENNEMFKPGSDQLKAINLHHL